ILVIVDGVVTGVHRTQHLACAAGLRVGDEQAGAADRQPPLPVGDRGVFAADVDVDALGREQAARNLCLEGVDVAGDGGEHGWMLRARRQVTLARMMRTMPLSRAFSCALLAGALSLAGCGRDDRADDAAGTADPAAPSQLVEWTLPSTLPGSASPGLAHGPGDRLLLSWINSQPGRRHILQFSSWST